MNEFSYLNNASAAFAVKANDIAKKLGLPERPKRPSSGFIRFLTDVRPSLQATTKSPTELAQEASNRWKSLDDNQKLKYKVAFEQENV